MAPSASIPVAVVTGFLGSGKTTLIARILRDPAFARTAVIVNEFGEIGLDHELIASSVATRSLRTAQHRQPVVSASSVSSLLAISSWSRPISPNSLTMTAVRAKPGSRKMREISVVLPLPRKPVTIATGIMARGYDGRHA